MSNIHLCNCDSPDMASPWNHSDSCAFRKKAEEERHAARFDTPAPLPLTPKEKLAAFEKRYQGLSRWQRLRHCVSLTKEFRALLDEVRATDYPARVSK